jgi:hypothetical protein
MKMTVDVLERSANLRFTVSWWSRTAIIVSAFRRQPRPGTQCARAHHRGARRVATESKGAVVRIARAGRAGCCQTISRVMVQS